MGDLLRAPLATFLAMAIAGAVLASSAAGCGGCPKIRQTVALVSPGSDLLPLIDACVAHRPGPGETCMTSTAYPPIACGCLALCRRALEIIDQFPGPEEIETCFYIPSQTQTAGDAGADAGTDFAGASHVDVTYRMSSCQ